MRMLESFDNQLDHLLTQICAEVQVAKSAHEEAESRYKGVTTWLAEAPAGSLLFHADPKLYAQGSLNLGTAIKPIGKNEFDVDLVCELQLNWGRTNPQAVIRAVYDRLHQNGTYQKLLPPNPPASDKRCVTLTYSNEFHIDILPACPISTLSDGNIKVADKYNLGAWKDSNPKGYAAWFDTRSQAYYEQVRAMLEKAEIQDFPDHETFKEKTPLQRSVQVLKRWRDVAFEHESNADIVPISIVITTLAAMNYQGETSINRNLSALLGTLSASILRRERIKVPNPTNWKEDFGERWDQFPGSYGRFTQWVLETERRWQMLNQSRGPKLSSMLREMFGEKVTDQAVRAQVELLEKSRASDQLGINKRTSGLTLGNMSAAAVLPLRKNTFYGA